MKNDLILKNMNTVLCVRDIPKRLRKSFRIPENVPESESIYFEINIGKSKTPRFQSDLAMVMQNINHKKLLDKNFSNWASEENDNLFEI